MAKTIQREIRIQTSGVCTDRNTRSEVYRWQRLYSGKIRMTNETGLEWILEMEQFIREFSPA